MINEELSFTLERAVDEVLGLLTGLDLTYNPEYDRFRAIARQLNRSMRATALEREWSYYSDLLSVGTSYDGQLEVQLPAKWRARMINDDSVRLVDELERPLRWAYFLPRDALHKYMGREGLWCSVTRNTLTFSRPLQGREVGLDIRIPVMREPEMFQLPKPITNDTDPDAVEIPDEVLQQEIDFPYPDMVILRAAYYYAQTDPVMQPRVQTIEAQWKDLMYQIIERDERSTDSPYLNEFTVPIQGGLRTAAVAHEPHPHSDERRY